MGASKHCCNDKLLTAGQSGGSGDIAWPWQRRSLGRRQPGACHVTPYMTTAEGSSLRLSLAPVPPFTNLQDVAAVGYLQLELARPAA